jgi:signal transduction histidine kinase
LSAGWRAAGFRAALLALSSVAAVACMWGTVPRQALTLASVPVRLGVRLDRRLPEPVELAAYHAVAEALANSAKHAQATAIDVDVQASEDELRVCVRTVVRRLSNREERPPCR